MNTTFFFLFFFIFFFLFLSLPIESIPPPAVSKHVAWRQFQLSLWTQDKFNIERMGRKKDKTQGICAKNIVKKQVRDEFDLFY